MNFSRDIEITQGLVAAARYQIKKLDSITGTDIIKANIRIDGMISDLQAKMKTLNVQLNNFPSDEKNDYSDELKDLDKDISNLQTELHRKRQVYS